MKSLATNTLTDFMLYDVVGGASPRPKIKTEYFSDTASTWREFDTGDIESRSIELSLENKRYNSYSFMPPVKSMNLQLNNFGQVYSTGSGDAKASILKKNLLVRAWSGYELISGLEDLSSVSDAFTNTAKFYHTQKSGSTVILDIASYTGATIATAAEIGGAVMGTAAYGTVTYGYPGYYTKTFKVAAGNDPVQFDINVSSSDFSFKYRVSKFSDFSDTTWSSFVSLNAGNNTVIVSAGGDEEYLQYLCRFNSSTWNTADKINSVSYGYNDVVSLQKRGTFVIDEPIYADKVRVVGRDYLRKALETEVNLPDLTVTKTVQKRLTEVFDRCNIPYDTADWDSVATTCEVGNATIAEQLENKSGWKVCDFLMDAVNAGDDDIFFTFDENGKALIKKFETDTQPDWVTHYRFNIESVNKSFDSDSQLQRCTAMNKSITVNPEITLGNFTGTTSGTSLHLTYGTTALYVRYTDVNNVINTETNRTNTGIDYGVNSGAAYDITLLGCHPKNLESGVVWAEAGNSNNILNNNGSTYKRVNPFLDSTKAKSFVDYLVGLNADPKFTVTVKQEVNPLLELGVDNILIFDKFTYTDSIYGPVSISENWNNPSLKESIKFKDRGFDLGDFIYDRAGLDPGPTDLKYDIGLVYDQDISVNATGDSTDYTRTNKQIAFS